jgi:hypothetical protein
MQQQSLGVTRLQRKMPARSVEQHKCSACCFLSLAFTRKIDSFDETDSEKHTLQFLVVAEAARIRGERTFLGKITMSLDLEQQIRERAYQLWERDGRVDGRADHYWHAAAREMTSVPSDAPDGDGDIIVAPAPEPKTRRRSPAAKAAPKTSPAAASRRRRSTTPVLSS